VFIFCKNADQKFQKTRIISTQYENNFEISDFIGRACQIHLIGTRHLSNQNYFSASDVNYSICIRCLEKGGS